MSERARIYRKKAKTPDNSNPSLKPKIRGFGESQDESNLQSATPAPQKQQNQENISLKQDALGGNFNILEKCTIVRPQENVQRQEVEEEKEDIEQGEVVQTKCNECEQEEQNQQESELVQTKLTVGEAGDKYEQEADSVAAKVVEQIHSPKSEQTVQGKVEPVVQPTLMRQGGVGGATVNEDVEQNIQQARDSGQSLANNVREPMEFPRIYRFPVPGSVIGVLNNLVELLNASCGPETPQTWGDFQGTPPTGSQYGAMTKFDYKLTTVDTQQVIQAVFMPSDSWVKPKFANPTDRTLNGCGRNISGCEQFFDKEANARRTGGSFSLRPPTGCAASIAANSSRIAKNRDECDSVSGTECDRVAGLESQRLLRHEQVHYELACKLAKKGTLAIINDKGKKPEKILSKVKRVANKQTKLYDKQTKHGCNAGKQAAWEAKIQAGLPGVNI